MKHLKSLCAILLVIAAAAGNSPVAAETVDTVNVDQAKGPYDTILIIGLALDNTMRRAYEVALADEMARRGSKGVSSFRLGRKLDLGDELTIDAVLTMVDESRADAVLLTRPLNRSVSMGKSNEEAILYVGPTVRVVEDEEHSMTAVVASNYAVDVVEGQSVTEADAELETLVFTPAMSTVPVYKITTKTEFELGPGEPIELAVVERAADLADRLHKDDIIH